MSDTYHIFTHNDLDGAVSLLTFMWSKETASFFYDGVSNLEIQKIKNHVSNTINCKNIYLFDLALRDEMLPVLDTSCVTIVDHHERSVPYVEKFKNAKILHKNYSSNSLLNKKLFIDLKKIELTENKNKLIELADDYDSLTLNNSESLDLNILFWTFYKNNFSGFVKDYKNGYKLPTKDQQNIISTEKEKAVKTIKQIQKFEGTLNIKGCSKKILGIQSDNLNVLCKNLIVKKYDYDIFFFINARLNKVTINQKNKENPVDLNSFAHKFCDGMGDSNVAVGKITPLFMELTKNLKAL